jgi:predicted TIM-barrel fold metal-dependent hydrolase
MEVIPSLSKFLLSLNVKICFDHFASPTLSPLEQDPYTVPGFRSLVSLLGTGKIFVKLSAPYRVSSDPRFEDLEPMTRELIRIAGKRNLVFATDWPHTRYEGFNVRHFIDTLIQWCGGDQDLIHRIFKYNAEELWDI